MNPISNNGSSFESFLVEEGILKVVDEAAIKNVQAALDAWNAFHETHGSFADDHSTL